MENSKRATVYFAPDVHKALRLRAAASDRSVSDMVNDAVRMSLAEDAIDLEAFASRRSEKNVSFESFVTGLKRRGRI
jgi:plasmid stability protein